jgi:hypothetical protein
VLAAWKRWQYTEATVTIAGDPDAVGAIASPAPARRTLPPEPPARNPFSPQRLANPS